jgi:HK97 family phage portal protein
VRFLGRELTFRRVEAEQKDAPFEAVLQRIMAVQEGWGGLFANWDQLVQPENCMRAPTVNAIVTAVSRRIAVSPLEVFKVNRVQIDTDKGERSAPRVRKERQPNHPVEKLLNAPNDWQTDVNYLQDSTSRLLRYGNFFAYKSRGSTGPIRALLPMLPRNVMVTQDLDTWKITYRYNGTDVDNGKVHHIRTAARNGFMGDSPIADVNSSIALEIAAEQFGASFFANGAMPLLIFKYMQGMQPFKDVEAEKKFIDSFQNAVGGSKRHRGLLLPKGLEVSDPVSIENDKAQFLETRKYQRTVIAGAFGVPPHLVGDLERATFNNVEQQSADFTINVVLPIAKTIEAAQERDLLTAQDRAGETIIRFDLDTIRYAQFKDRQEGFRLMRDEGVLCPNDWRELENLNPIPEEDGGEDYIRAANFVVAGEPLPVPVAPAAAPAAPAEKPPAADTAKLLAGFREEIKGELLALAERVAGRAEPVVIHNHVPEQPRPIVYVAPEFAPVIKVEPTPFEVTVEAPRAPVVNVHVPPPPVTETVPVRDKATGKLLSLVNRPLKYDEG